MTASHALSQLSYSPSAYGHLTKRKRCVNKNRIKEDHFSLWGVGFRMIDLNTPTISPHPVVGAGLVSARFGESISVIRAPTRGAPTMEIIPFDKIVTLILLGYVVDKFETRK